MRETSRLSILISAYEGGVGHVYSQSRGCGQRKIFWGGAPDPDLFCPPPIKIPGGATDERVSRKDWVHNSCVKSGSREFEFGKMAKIGFSGKFDVTGKFKAVDLYYNSVFGQKFEIFFSNEIDSTISVCYIGHVFILKCEPFLTKNRLY